MVRYIDIVFDNESTSATAITAGRKRHSRQDHTETFWWMNHHLVSLAKADDSWNTVHYLWLREQHKDSQPLNDSCVTDEADRKHGWVMNITALTYECHVVAVEFCKTVTVTVQMTSGIKDTYTFAQRHSENHLKWQVVWKNRRKMNGCSW